MDLKEIFEEIEGGEVENTTVQTAKELALSLLRIVERRAGTFCDPDDAWYPVISSLAEIAGYDMDEVYDLWHTYTI